MKLIKALSISPVILFLPNRIGPEESHYYITANAFGGYHEYCENQQITIVNEGTSLLRNARNRLWVYNSSGRIAYEKISQEITITPYKKESVTITLPTREYLSENGMHCKLFLVDSEASKIYVEKDFTIYPVESVPECDLSKNKVTTYASLPTQITLKKENVSSDVITYNFSALTDYFKIDNYYRLSISLLKFSISSGIRITDENSYIYLKNPAECFSSLMNNEGEVKIPINIKQSTSTTKYIEFSDTFYVEPSSLKMSLTPKIGYVQTKYFYFPINKLQDVLKQKFIFKLNNVGSKYSRVNITFAVDFNTEINLIGDCSNSEYCLVGGVRA